MSKFILDTLHSQVGRTLTERTTQTFMTLLTREHLQEALDRDGSPGSKVVEKYVWSLQNMYYYFASPFLLHRYSSMDEPGMCMSGMHTIILI